MLMFMCMFYVAVMSMDGKKQPFGDVAHTSYEVHYHPKYIDNERNMR